MTPFWDRRGGRPLIILSAVLLALEAGRAQAESTLAARLAEAQRKGVSTWLAWSVSSVEDVFACCWSNREGRPSNTCSLTDENGMSTSQGDGRPGDSAFTVYVHTQGSAVDNVRIFSSSCRVDRGAEKVEEIAGVGASESVSALEGLLGSAETGRPAKRRRDRAITAIALHDDPAADRALERVAREGETLELRKSAAFWLGNTRGRAGYEALNRLRRSDDAAFREHLTLALSQSHEAEASTALIDMARNDSSSRVPGQALFWIAQKAEKKAEREVVRAAVDDPDEEVKKKAVFALSQIPHGEGVPELIRVAQENKNREVRKQAMFWLGQSKDPRALEFFERILSRE